MMIYFDGFYRSYRPVRFLRYEKGSGVTNYAPIQDAQLSARNPGSDCE